MITEVPMPILILTALMVALGIAITIFLEIRQRQYNVSAYLLWIAALAFALLGFTQEVLMAGITMFFIAFILIIISTTQQLNRRKG